MRCEIPCFGDLVLVQNAVRSVTTHCGVRLHYTLPLLNYQQLQFLEVLLLHACHLCPGDSLVAVLPECRGFLPELGEYSSRAEFITSVLYNESEVAGVQTPT